MSSNKIYCLKHGKVDPVPVMCFGIPEDVCPICGSHVYDDPKGGWELENERVVNKMILFAIFVAIVITAVFFGCVA
jgi:hypothetical protein